ncbi:MAG: hypothetical protein FWD96_04135 [Defluviitaleaceae bacterium]|nr:hypothetical protein [Defluviitaleaceae bacterium]
MNVKNCPECGKMYMQNSFGMCDACRLGEEAGFQAIKDYISEHPNSTVIEVSQETGVRINRIMGYIREGRLMATPGMASDITCRSCGKAVEKGNFCDSCTVKMNNTIKEMYEDNKVETKMTGMKMNVKNRF